MTGWRIGYIAGRSDVVKAISTLQSQSTSNPNSIAQAAAAAALNGDHSFLKERTRIFKSRRDFMVKELNSARDYQRLFHKVRFIYLSHVKDCSVKAQKVLGFMLQRNFLIWLLASLFYAYQYILRVIPNIIAPELITKFNISIVDVGQFGGLYYIGYMLAHIPVGLALDRFGPKFVLPACIVLTFAGTLPLICFDEWYYSILGRIIVGIGSSASAIGLFKVASMYFSQEKSARMASLSIVIGLLGAIYGGLPLDFLLNKFGWNYVIYTFSAFGCLLALLLVLITPSSSSEESASDNIFQDLKNCAFQQTYHSNQLFWWFNGWTTRRFC
ncbi:MFS transporter [Trichonephila clavata]|uniref:MFS transporter n=1 Tax=Trichonephila clavata TaxID=2740835 RepID=A0A8X6L4S4_TRICU|nr:MFS transporter [Trichonephila clavata]